LEPGVKVNGDYYRNTVLLNMLLLDIRSVFGDYYVFSKMGHQQIMHVTLSPCCRERDARVYPSRDVATYSPDLNPVDYSIWDMLQERVYRSWIHDVS